MKVYLCMKWGTKYGADYVNRLYAGLDRWTEGPFRLICLTDDNAGIRSDVEVREMPSTGLDEAAMDARKGGETWRKVGLYMPALLDEEELLFLDLDVVVMGPMDRLFDHAPGSFCIIHDWLEKRRGRKGGNSSVVRFSPRRHAVIFEHYRENSGEILQRFRIEQKYVTWAARELAGGVAFWPPEWMQSFKRSCRRIFPLNLCLEPPRPRAGCSVLVFHGDPKPPEAVEGFRGGPFQTTRPAPWLRGHWNGNGRQL